MKKIFYCNDNVLQLYKMFTYKQSFINSLIKKYLRRHETGWILLGQQRRAKFPRFLKFTALAQSECGVRSRYTFELLF